MRQMRGVGRRAQRAALNSQVQFSAKAIGRINAALAGKGPGWGGLCWNDWGHAPRRLCRSGRQPASTVCCDGCLQRAV